ncbi:hypothetical protein ACRAWF_43535 [Streptomyces sp. L7]
MVDPRALYEHVHRTSSTPISMPPAAGQVSDFLSEQVLRGTLPMQVDGGIYSPVITDARRQRGGHAAPGHHAHRRYPAAAEHPGPDQPRKPPGQHREGRSLLQDTPAVWASAAAPPPRLTGDHSQGHPDASGTIGGSLGLRGQTQATVTNTYSASSSAGTMHAIRTNRGHLLTPSGVTYQVTLIRPNGTETQAPALTRRTAWTCGS